MVIKPFLLLLNTDLDGGCDQQLSDDHQKFMTLSDRGELSCHSLRQSAVQRYGWCPPKCYWFTWPKHAPFRMVCHPWASTYYPSTYLPNLKSLPLTEDTKGK